MHDLIVFKDAVICDLITVGSEHPCLHILHCSRPAGPLEEALADIEFQNSYITVRHCSRFEFACYLYTRDTAWTLARHLRAFVLLGFFVFSMRPKSVMVVGACLALLPVLLTETE